MGRGRFYGLLLVVVAIHVVALLVLGSGRDISLATRATTKMVVQTVALSPPQRELPTKREEERRVEVPPKKVNEPEKKVELSASKGRIDEKALQKAREQLAHSSPSESVSSASLSLPEVPSLMTETQTVGDWGEDAYRDGLVNQLHLLLRLPERDEVCVDLTLFRNGRVKEMTILSSKSATNRRCVEEKLLRMHFPPFGKEFSGEEEHTFHLCLTQIGE